MMTTPELAPIPEGLQGTIITDCADANARARQEIRFKHLFGVIPTFVGLTAERDFQDLEAAGQLVDALDAADTHTTYRQAPNVILANVAPRGDDIREHWENGTPFCYFKLGANTVLAPYEGRALALAGRLGLVRTARLLDVPSVTRTLAQDGVIKKYIAKAIDNSQFRSLHFLPLAASELARGRSLPNEKLPVPVLSEPAPAAWYVDSFGNVKTTLLKSDLPFKPGRVITLAGGQKATCYRRLTDVPTGELAITIGSSGYRTRRWLEVVIQKGDAAAELGIKIGSPVLGDIVQTPANG
ncbi:MAG TPA: SAM hydroxide adenosyltransferase [Candidatus Saccharimonadales bacterium]|nr:SAM hydroxide adenosyltransferase [Candidatus Saccharimonadales bacterium]